MLVGADFFLSHRVFVANSQRKLYFTYNGGPVFKLDRSGDAPPRPPSRLTPQRSMPDGYRRRASASVARRDSATRKQTTEPAADLDPKTAQRMDRATARLSLGRPVLALEDLSTAIELDPKNARALLLRGEDLSVRGRQGQARSNFDLAVAAAPNDPDSVRTISIFYGRAKDYRRRHRRA
jgi:tetratricopeptide (TPR) repeat protein